jgi:hypothetical protein
MLAAASGILAIWHDVAEGSEREIFDSYDREVKNWILGRYAPCGRHLVVLAQHSGQVLNAILSMADRQDLLLASKVEDLRRKVYELATIIGETHAHDH